MAKVSDLNGCFVRVNSKDEQRKIEIAMEKVSCNYIETFTINGLDCHSVISLRTDGTCKTMKPKEIYFHEGEFYDAPVKVVNIELPKIKWTGGSVDKQEAIEWSNGDEVYFFGAKALFIGHSKLDKGMSHIEALINGEVTPFLMVTKNLKKPETEAEKKTRKLAEEVNRICFELFGTPAFDCNQEIIDTVEKFIVNGYKKVD